MINLPSAQSAHPEYEFKTVITTGISAPPIAEVNVTPMMLERREVAPTNIYRIVAYQKMFIKKMKWKI